MEKRFEVKQGVGGLTSGQDVLRPGMKGGLYSGLDASISGKGWGGLASGGTPRN